VLIVNPHLHRRIFPGLLAVVLLLGPAPAAAGRERPNVVLMVADDLGFSDIGSYGGEIPTPHIDRLARRGLRYSQFYNNARCSPTRASLLTGVYPHSAGVGHMTADLGRPAYRGFLGERTVTIAEALKTAGYQTFMSGKWHVGSRPEHWPRRRGFDRYYGVITGAVYFKENFRVRSEGQLVEDDTALEVPDDFYSTEAFADRAVAYLDEAARNEAPFFLYYAHIAPHFPLQAKESEITTYRNRYKVGWDEVRAERWKKIQTLGLLDPRWKLSPRNPEVLPWKNESPAAQADQALRMAIYAAQIDALDRAIGRVLDKLEAMRKLDNTLVLFLSDNGGCGEGGRHGFDRGGGKPLGSRESYYSIGASWANVSNTPFRHYKHYIHEGGIATPFIVHWPARIDPKAQGGQVRHHLGHVMDLLPTILEAAGARPPRSRKGARALALDGVSLLPSFRDRPRPVRRSPLFWEHEGNRGVRDGKWKLVAVHGGAWELYDLDQDRTELVDLAPTNPARVKRLSRLYDDWARSRAVLSWSDIAEQVDAAAPSVGAGALGP
jgi:arylsulfatase A-like enzyme